MVSAVLMCSCIKFLEMMFSFTLTLATIFSGGTLSSEILQQLLLQEFSYTHYIWLKQDWFSKIDCLTSKPTKVFGLCS